MRAIVPGRFHCLSIAPGAPAGQRVGAAVRLRREGEERKTRHHPPGKALYCRERRVRQPFIFLTTGGRCDYNERDTAVQPAKDSRGKPGTTDPPAGILASGVLPRPKGHTGRRTMAFPGRRFPGSGVRQSGAHAGPLWGSRYLRPQRVRKRRVTGVSQTRASGTSPAGWPYTRSLRVRRPVVESNAGISRWAYIIPTFPMLLPQAAPCCSIERSETGRALRPKRARNAAASTARSRIP